MEYSFPNLLGLVFLLMVFAVIMVVILFIFSATRSHYWQRHQGDSAWLNLLSYSIVILGPLGLAAFLVWILHPYYGFGWALLFLVEAGVAIVISTTVEAYAYRSPSKIS